MNWYMETKLRHGTSEWDILHEGFLLTFTFEDRWWDIVDDALQVVKTVIFRTPQRPMEEVQPKWATQLHHMLECYIINVEEEDEHSRKISILQTEGYREVQEAPL